MKCLVLAAGYATRLYPLTENFPKPLLRVGEKTILDWLLDDIQASGAVEEFVVISNHKYLSCFREWAGTKPYKITLVDDGTETNETRLGAVNDMRLAQETLSSGDDLLVVAGDNLLDFSLAGFLAYAAGKKASCVMRYFEPSLEKLKKCGVLTVDADDRIRKMTEKSPSPASHWCCPPFYFYTREDAARLPEAIAAGCETDAPGSFLGWLCERSTVYAMEMPGRRYDIGNLESYEEVKKEYRGISVC